MRNEFSICDSSDSNSSVGTNHELSISGTLQRLATEDFGEPLHSLCIVGKLHPLEADMLKHFAVDKSDIPVL